MPVVVLIFWGLYHVINAFCTNMKMELNDISFLWCVWIPHLLKVMTKRAELHKNLVIWQKSKANMWLVDYASIQLVSQPFCFDIRCLNPCLLLSRTMLFADMVHIRTWLLSGQLVHALNHWSLWHVIIIWTGVGAKAWISNLLLLTCISSARIDSILARPFGIVVWLGLTGVWVESCLSNWNSGHLHAHFQCPATQALTWFQNGRGVNSVYLLCTVLPFVGKA